MEHIESEKPKLSYEELVDFLSRYAPCGILWRLHLGPELIVARSGTTFVFNNTFESDPPFPIPIGGKNQTAD